MAGKFFPKLICKNRIKIRDLPAIIKNVNFYMKNWLKMKLLKIDEKLMFPTQFFGLITILKSNFKSLAGKMIICQNEIQGNIYYF